MGAGLNHFRPLKIRVKSFFERGDDLCPIDNFPLLFATDPNVISPDLLIDGCCARRVFSGLEDGDCLSFGDNAVEKSS